jgi:hypothetical protein
MGVFSGRWQKKGSRRPVLHYRFCIARSSRDKVESVTIASCAAPRGLGAPPWKEGYFGINTQ